jgi:hypothetical protein
VCVLTFTVLVSIRLLATISCGGTKPARSSPSCWKLCCRRGCMLIGRGQLRAMLIGAPQNAAPPALCWRGMATPLLAARGGLLAA